MVTGGLLYGTLWDNSMRSIKDAMRYSMLLMKRRMTMEQCKKSGRDASVEGRRISLMLRRKDAVIAVGSTLIRLGRLRMTLSSTISVMLKIEQH